MERHADPLDVSLELTMTETQSLINSRKNIKECQETGFCAFCSEPVDLGDRWCDENCRDDWQREEDAKIRSGKKP